MTAFGKILVFLNLIGALVVGSFAVMTYVARTHWAVKHEKLSKSFTVLEATNTAHQIRIDQLTAERKQFNQTLAEQGKTELGKVQDPAEAARQTIVLLKQRGDAVARLSGELKTRTQDLEDTKTELGKYKTTTGTSQEDSKRRQLDTEKLREILKAETEKNIELVKGINEMRDRAVAAEIQSRSLRDINGRLEGQLQDMARDLARIKATGGRPALASTVNPPPEQVEGLIQRVDGKYVTLTIGGDAGLLKGHTMDVFGLGTSAGYRGRIRLVEVTPHQAVGELMGRASSPIKVGDTVASSILGKR